MDKSLLIISVGRGIQVLLSVIIIKISTSLLSTEEMGIFYLLTSILAYFGLTLISPIGNFLNRKVHSWKAKGQLLGNFYRYLLYTLSISLLSIPIIFVSTRYLGVLTQIGTIHLIAVVSIGIVFTTLNTFFAPTLNLLNHRMAFVTFGNLTLLFNILFSVIFVTYFQKLGILWFAGQILAQALLAFISGSYFFKVIDEESNFRDAIDFNLNSFRPVLQFALPLAVATFFLWATNESYRFVIEKFLTLHYLGLIGVSIALSTKISTAVETLIHQFFHPEYFSAITSPMKDSRDKAWNIFFRHSLPSYISVTIFSSFMAPFLLQILAGKEFHEAWPFLIFGSFINLFRMITNHMALIAHSEFKTSKLILPGFISAIFTVGLVSYSTTFNNYYYLIPLSLVCGSFIGLIAMFVRMNKIIKISIHLRDVLIACFFAILYMPSIFLYDRKLSIFISLGVVSLFGLYFIFTQLYFFRRFKIL